MAAGTANAETRAEHAERQLKELQAHSLNLQNELDAARLAAGRPSPEPAEALSHEAEAELEARLREAQRALSEALAGGTATAAQAAELAVLTAQLDATRAKRRRLAPSNGA